MKNIAVKSSGLYARKVPKVTP